MTTLLLLWLTLSQSENPFNQADILIVASSSIQITSINQRALRRLFLKQTDHIQGQSVTPIQLSEDHPLRLQFDRMIFGPHFDPENYWIEQKFLAGESPPVRVNNEAFVLIFLKRNDNLIGYVHRNLLGEVERLGLKVLNFTPSSPPAYTSQINHN